jgi:hypothetical protein
MAGPPRTSRLAYWNADSVCGNKLEQDLFLSEHIVDICLLNKMHLQLDKALRFRNHFFHWMACPTQGGITVILVCSGIYITTLCQSWVCSTWRREKDMEGMMFLSEAQV